MLSKLVALITGKDELERVAYREDPELLLQYLSTHPLLVPIRPKEFLDAASATEAELLDSIESSARATAEDAVDLWTEEIDGVIRLPAFSRQKKAQHFAAELSQQLNMIFGLGCVQFLLSDLVASQVIDVIDLNPLSPQCWEIDVRGLGGSGGDLG